jgi:hypothetical protein
MRSCGVSAMRTLETRERLVVMVTSALTLTVLKPDDSPLHFMPWTRRPRALNHVIIVLGRLGPVGKVKFV